MSTALEVVETIPADSLVDAVGVTQDGWIRFTNGTEESEREEARA